MAMSTTSASTRRPDPRTKSSDRWDRLLEQVPPTTPSREASDGSDTNPTPDSTFSIPNDPKASRRTTPASSVCGQEYNEPESPAAPCTPNFDKGIKELVARPPRSPSIFSSLRGIRLPQKQDDLLPSPSAPSTTSPTHPDAVNLPIPSKKMYQFKGVPGLFVGFEDQVPPPPHQTTRFKKDVEPRFWTDASEFQRRLMRTKLGFRHPPGISLELRMSGRASTRSPLVTYVALIPQIWVLYDHDRWKREVTNFVKELVWLNHEGFGAVEIRRGSPRLSTLNPSLFVEGLSMRLDQGFPISDTLHLYLHAEARSGLSAVGRLCCATVTRNGIVCGQRISRIGGTLHVDSHRKLAITTAHGMLEVAWEAVIDDFEPEGAHDFDSGDLSPSSACSGSDDSSTFGDSPWPMDAWPTIPMGPKPQDVKSWEPVQILGLTSFLGSASLDPKSLDPKSATFRLGTSGVESRHEDTDFSLLGIPGADKLENLYLPFGETLTKPLLNDSPGSFLMRSSGTVGLDLLLGAEQSLQVQLLPEESQFMIRGVRFTVRKIRTKAPLGPGCSGLWVAHGASLVGMIIASYDDEPYAHFIPSDVLLSKVRSTVADSRECPVLEPSLPIARGFQMVNGSSFQFGQMCNNYMDVQSMNAIHPLGLEAGPMAEFRTRQILASRNNTILKKIMHEEVRLMLWPKTPLNMTFAKRNQLRASLTTLSPFIRKISRALGIWYSCTHDTTRARQFMRFKFHAENSSSEDPTHLMSPEAYLCITVDDVKDGFAILESITKDLATWFPSFLKSNIQRSQKPTKPVHGQLRQASPNGLSPSRKRQTSSTDISPSSQKRRKPNSDPTPPVVVLKPSGPSPPGSVGNTIAKKSRSSPGSVSRTTADHRNSIRPDLYQHLVPLYAQGSDTPYYPSVPVGVSPLHSYCSTSSTQSTSPFSTGTQISSSGSPFSTYTMQRSSSESPFSSASPLPSNALRNSALTYYSGAPTPQSRSWSTLSPTNGSEEPSLTFSGGGDESAPIWTFTPEDSDPGLANSEDSSELFFPEGPGSSSSISTLDIDATWRRMDRGVAKVSNFDVESMLDAGYLEFLDLTGHDPSLYGLGEV